MGDDRHRGLDRGTAERLASGDRVDPTRLADLIAHATLPAYPSELAGEERAVAAFRIAQAAVERPAAVGARWARGVARTARWGGVKLAVAVCIVAAGGLALASVAGIVPNPLIDDRPVSTQSPTRSRTTPASMPATADGASSLAGPSASALAAMTGLCRSYLETSDRSKVRDNPEFTQLVAVAGGADQVPAFCAALDARQGGNPHPSGDPGNSGNHEPTDHPTGPPSPHPGPSH